jgi:putative transposase
MTHSSVSDRPQRTNEYTAEPITERYRECVFEWLVAHAPLWNQITYRRRQEYFTEDGDVWDAQYTDLYDDYAPILGKAACQQVARKNAEAWRSHFDLLEKYHSDDPTVTEKPSPPGYWGNRDDGYDLHGLVRHDLYDFDWDEDRSTLEFGVGDALEEKYDFAYQERVTLEVRGNPQWRGDDSRLELIYDETADVFRVKHPVRIRPDHVIEQRRDAFTHTLDPENTTHTAAIDVGANNTLAIVTETGDTAVYHARPEFARFQVLSKVIAELQSQLPDDRYTSKRIQRVYDKRGEKRDHSRDAAVKHAASWLLSRNVDTVYVGDLTDVLETHWSAEVNAKTHAFWSHRQLVDRIQLTFGDVGIAVESVSEADTSSICPACGSKEVTRDGDAFRCHDCGSDVHSDIAGAWNLLQSEIGPMARPAALFAERGRDAPTDGAYWEWDGHDWTPGGFGEQSLPFDQTSVGEPASSQPG